MNLADIEAEYWAHRFTEHPGEKNQLVDDDFDQDEIEAEWAALDAAEEAALNNPDNWEALN